MQCMQALTSCLLASLVRRPAPAKCSTSCPGRRRSSGSSKAFCRRRRGCQSTQRICHRGRPCSAASASSANGPGGVSMPRFEGLFSRQGSTPALSLSLSPSLSSSLHISHLSQSPLLWLSIVTLLLSSRLISSHLCSSPLLSPPL